MINWIAVSSLNISGIDYAICFTSNSKEVFLKRVLAAKLLLYLFPNVELRDGFEPPIFTDLQSVPLSHFGIGA